MIQRNTIFDQVLLFRDLILSDRKKRIPPLFRGLLRALSLRVENHFVFFRKASYKTIPAVMARFRLLIFGLAMGRV